MDSSLAPASSPTKTERDKKLQSGRTGRALLSHKSVLAYVVDILSALYHSHLLSMWRAGPISPIGAVADMQTPPQRLKRFEFFLDGKNAVGAVLVLGPFP